MHCEPSRSCLNAAVATFVGLDAAFTVNVWNAWAGFD